MKLSILIPSTEDRREMTEHLFWEIFEQIKESGLGYGMTYWFLPDGWLIKSKEIEVRVLMDKKQFLIGYKRNKLLESAKGEYLCFIDSDDSIAPNYIDLVLGGIESNPDCLSLKGEYSVDGVFDGVFEHSIKYDKWETKEGEEIKYLRNTNHLNVIRASIAKQFKFPETNFGEDHHYSKQLQASGLLKTEVYIDEILYYYKYNSKKHENKRQND